MMMTRCDGKWGSGIKLWTFEKKKKVCEYAQMMLPDKLKVDSKLIVDCWSARLLLCYPWRVAVAVAVALALWHLSRTSQ